MENLQPVLLHKTLRMHYQQPSKPIQSQEPKLIPGQLHSILFKPFKNTPPQHLLEVTIEPILLFFPKIRQLSSTVHSAMLQMEEDTVFLLTSILELYSYSKLEIMLMLMLILLVYLVYDYSTFKSIYIYLY
jgi:hypothetical protein